ncbi:regulatory protein, Fis family [Chitinophaga sp. YR573]|uniref:sigma-54 interaction domain-containing protein n=1 Tax=Chitinophaga sp. YR573 TaxID=1881040 RepID=UPI0008B9106E|nr:sigma-54 dependent transcriptional regulator [Chitinophaga sp. YR573]SEW43016.1 regulatory protein, Fis family [Chitinophaga sp. YR573]
MKKESSQEKEKEQTVLLSFSNDLSDTSFSEIIGAGTEMQKIFHLISQVAPSESTVLLMGETGTGKELIARAIHNGSPYKGKLMVKVNCATLPPNLIESELFGHEKGSFTGATERRIGKFELANNSTLFLDEIGELPMELQAKLLRVLQEKEIERIGGRGSIKVNVRIIAATNRHLQKEVDAGRFRSDLFYRLNVFPVTLPPLRNRKEDIPVLTTHFVARYARNAGKKINNVSPKVMESLLTYSWPGNVRELEHLVERSVLLTNGTTIREMYLPAGNQKEMNTGEFTIVPLDEMERTYILKVLKVCKGRISGPFGAAVKLGLPSTTLISKMQKLGIKKEHFHDPL